MLSYVPEIFLHELFFILVANNAIYNNNKFEMVSLCDTLFIKRSVNCEQRI